GNASCGELGEVFLPHVEQLAREHHHQHLEFAVEAELIRPVRVVQGKVAGDQRGFPAVLGDQAVAAQLRAQFQVSGIRAADGVRGERSTRTAPPLTSLSCTAPTSCTTSSPPKASSVRQVASRGTNALDTASCHMPNCSAVGSELNLMMEFIA